MERTLWEGPGWLPQAAYADLEKTIGFPLDEEARKLIETGIAKSWITRDIQRSNVKEGRELYVEIERCTRDLDRAIKKAFLSVHVPLFLHFLGSDDHARWKAFAPDQNPRQRLMQLSSYLQILNRGATRALRVPTKGSGANLRKDKRLLSAFVVKALAGAAKRSRSHCDAKLVRRFAHAFFPYVPTPIASPTKDAFEATLVNEFKAQALRSQKNS